MICTNMFEAHHKVAAFRGTPLHLLGPLDRTVIIQIIATISPPCFHTTGFAGCWGLNQGDFSLEVPWPSPCTVQYAKKEQLLAGTVSLVVKSNVHRSNPRVVKTGTAGQWLFFLYIL